MLIPRKMIRQMMEELDRILEQVEREVEESVKKIFEEQHKMPKPLLYGVAIKLGHDGKPIIYKFGNREENGFREPIYDQIVDKEKGELKLIVELPGVEKEDIDVKASSKEVKICAERNERRYNASIALREEIEEDSAKAMYRNGILEILFKLKGNTNKGLRKIRVE
jgi:HSP20 family protein